MGRKPWFEGRKFYCMLLNLDIGHRFDHQGPSEIWKWVNKLSKDHHDQPLFQVHANIDGLAKALGSEDDLI